MPYNIPLKQAREERGWSQKDVAEKIGTDAKTVSRWERRVAYPSPYFRQKLSDLFQKSLRELDLLNFSEKQPEDDGPSIPELPEKLSESEEKRLDEHVDEVGQQHTSRPLAASIVSDQPITLQQQNRARMLGRLRLSYAELLEYALQKIVRIELDLAEMPNAVQNATNRLVRQSRQNTQALLPSTSILEAYEMSEHELLILGEPGAGKSTLLLHLAQTLVQRAEKDETYPLPVMLRLSSWAEKKPALEEWMSEQLALTYDISQKLSTRWVRNEQLLPLLDGLDEMDTASRSACIAAINAYHREHLLVPLVVCSRRTEYEDAASQQKLALQHAVLIQPLTLEQVYASLDQTDQLLDALRQTLQTNMALQELTTTPLKLSILLLTYSKTRLPTLSHEISTLQRQMWTDYVAHMTELRGNAEHYSFQQTTAWLSWLARNLQKHYQTVFYLERVQLDWLPTNLQQRAFWLTMLVPLFLLGILSSCIIGSFLQTVFDLTTGIQAALLGCLLVGCISQSDNTHTQAKWRRYTLWKGFISIGTGLAVGLSFGFELGSEYGSSDWLRDGLLYGTIIGIACLLLLILLPRVSSRYSLPQMPRIVAPLGRMFSLIHLRRALIGAPLLGLAYGLSTALSYGMNYGPGTTLNIMLSYGGVIYLLSLIVEENRGNISLTERLRWTWSGFFSRLHSFKHCMTSLAMGISVLLVVGLSYGLTIGVGFQVSNSLGFRLNYGSSEGLSPGFSPGPDVGLKYGLMMGLIVGVGIGLCYWFTVGIFQSIAQEQIEDQDRQSLNQGVRRSVLNSTIIGLLSGGSIGGLGFMGYWLSYWLNEGLSKGLKPEPSEGLGYALSVMWLFALSGCVFGWGISGGWAVLRHFILRWLLHRRHIFPWRAQAFLDDATARILLQRVGGGYSFIHRLLLEYFADLDNENISDKV